MWSSRFFSARYWTSRFFSASGSDAPPSDDLLVGLASPINPGPNGVIGFIHGLNNGLKSVIVLESGVLSTITTDPDGVYAGINSNETGIESLMT